jgi:hypothetical protein
MEIETEEPRSGARRIHDTREAGGDGDEAGEDAGAADPGSTGNAPGAGRTATMAGTANQTGQLTAPQAGAPGAQKKLIIRKVTTAVKLNNNALKSIAQLPEALSGAMNNPIANLQWLDLSFNQLERVEDTILTFGNLKALYLHGNCIRSLQGIEKLKKFDKLIILTLNGNPIESSKIYRPYVIGALAKLKSLDHSSITDDEKSTALTWFQGHLQRKKERDLRLQDQALMENEM